MKDRKLLVIYNTCGISGRNNTDWYVKSLNKLLEQNFDNYRVVFSSCLNSEECRDEIFSTFGGKISYCHHSQPHTVNVTFNKTVQECVKHFGEFEGYLYVDSGILFTDDAAMKNAYDLFKRGTAAFVTIQVDTDTGFDQIGLEHETGSSQVNEENMVIPVGKACNLHSQIFSNEAFKVFNKKLMPDVFKAYCTESTFSFLCAALKKNWAVLKEVMLHHKKGVDGASSSVPHWSPEHGNPWNNLFCGRDARQFIEDPAAQEAGLGYEECNEIMMHDPTKYDEKGHSKSPQKLIEMINKYFFLTEEELDYDKIQCEFRA
jgi:hypothetical protein